MNGMTRHLAGAALLLFSTPALAAEAHCPPAATAVKLVSSDIAQVPAGFDGKPAGLPIAFQSYRAEVPHGLVSVVE